jgi:hypothetical protein
MPISRRTLLCNILGLCLLTPACVPPGAIQNARVAPAGSTRGNVYVAGDRLAVAYQEPGKADRSTIFGLGDLGGSAGIGFGGGQELGGGLRYTNGLDLGLSLWWKSQLLGSADPRSLALSLEAGLDTRLFVIPYDPQVSLLLAVPLGHHDLLLNARYGYLWTTQDVGPGGLDYATDSFLPPNGSFGEAQAAFVFDADSSTSPYLGLSVRQYVQPVRTQTGSTLTWRFDPVARLELGLQFSGQKKAKPEPQEKEEDP